MASPTKHASPRKASPKKVAKASPKKVTKASPKKVNKVKAKVVKKPASHPKYTEMITAAIVALKNRGGSSRDAIKKYICANYKVGDNANTQLRLAFRRALKAGTIFQKKGISGSFRLTDEAKKQMTVKKPVKKVAPTKKKSATAAKKVAKKISKSKKVTPKKKKPTAKKTSTKKAKKLVGKKPGAKKVKRTPAKKAKKPTKK